MPLAFTQEDFLVIQKKSPYGMDKPDTEYWQRIWDKLRFGRDGFKDWKFNNGFHSNILKDHNFQNSLLL